MKKVTRKAKPLTPVQKRNIIRKELKKHIRYRIRLHPKVIRNRYGRVKGYSLYEISKYL